MLIRKTQRSYVQLLRHEKPYLEYEKSANLSLSAQQISDKVPSKKVFYKIFHSTFT